ncbi:unnamed protein product [Jaminaea pallidilutea]
MAYSQQRRGGYDPRRICLIPLPSLPRWLSSSKRSLGIYTSGALFALGWWMFLDAVILSSISNRPPQPPNGGGGGGGDGGDQPLPWDPPVVVTSFADWLPGLCGTLGMIVVNLIDKSLLAEAGIGGALFGGGGGGGLGGGGDITAWRAKLFLFIGFALMAGGLAGSVTVLVVKYIVPGYPEYYGVANVIQNAALMLSTICLWMAQQTEGEYDYNLTI